VRPRKAVQKNAQKGRCRLPMLKPERQNVRLSFAVLQQVHLVPLERTGSTEQFAWKKLLHYKCDGSESAGVSLSRHQIDRSDFLVGVVFDNPVTEAFGLGRTVAAVRFCS
jgi:hypothetical protein